VPAGTSVRFEPGLPRDVWLVPLAGNRIVPGLRGLAGGPLDGASAGGGSADGAGPAAEAGPAADTPEDGSPQ
jgi:urease subunit beta